MVPPSDGGLCFWLGTSELTVSRATVTAFKEGDQFSTVIKFGPADAAGFDDLARQHLGQQVALVAFGHILSAPQINTDSFHGVAQVYGLTEDQAAQLKAALSG